MRILKNLRSSFATTRELMAGLWRGPYWWLVPVIMLLMPAALFFVFLQAYPLVAPFVYTVF